ncbi:hypothetical protein RCL_jg9714.t1 [Rhizophagus clarus]|uniref:Uncharacterized protein n=1 Tax=Rhizophagus clarus TaxID=94130 RepID=A0A8H3QWS9_9GLOM|nr:hypothetical protein RCL_jg9714.t1 [Rhizophagus clarus]
MSQKNKDQIDESECMVMRVLTGATIKVVKMAKVLAVVDEGWNIVAPWKGIGSLDVVVSIHAKPIMDL